MIVYKVPPQVYTSPEVNNWLGSLPLTKRGKNVYMRSTSVSYSIIFLNKGDALSFALKFGAYPKKIYVKRDKKTGKCSNNDSIGSLLSEK